MYGALVRLTLYIHIYIVHAVRQKRGLTTATSRIASSVIFWWIPAADCGTAFATLFNNNNNNNNNNQLLSSIIITQPGPRRLIYTREQNCPPSPSRPSCVQWMCNMPTCRRFTARRKSPEVKFISRTSAASSTFRFSALQIIFSLSIWASGDTWKAINLNEWNAVDELNQAMSALYHILRPCALISCIYA